jgi:hypothetical protein
MIKNLIQKYFYNKKVWNEISFRGWAGKSINTGRLVVIETYLNGFIKYKYLIDKHTGEKTKAILMIWNKKIN